MYKDPKQKAGNLQRDSTSVPSALHRGCGLFCGKLSVQAMSTDEDAAKAFLSW